MAEAARVAAEAGRRLIEAAKAIGWGGEGGKRCLSSLQVGWGHGSRAEWIEDGSAMEAPSWQQEDLRELVARQMFSVE